MRKCLNCHGSAEAVSRRSQGSPGTSCGCRQLEGAGTAGVRMGNERGLQAAGFCSVHGFNSCNLSKLHARGCVLLHTWVPFTLPLQAKP